MDILVVEYSSLYWLIWSHTVCKCNLRIFMLDSVHTSVVLSCAYVRGQNKLQNHVKGSRCSMVETLHACICYVIYYISLIDTNVCCISCLIFDFKQRVLQHFHLFINALNSRLHFYHSNSCFKNVLEFYRMKN